MIFVTLGSQKFQFNRLLKKIDDLIEEGVIKEEVFAQIGYSNYIPSNYNYNRFIDRDEFNNYIEKSDLIITHGGTGLIVNAIKKDKKVIAVARMQKYGEHIDNHQLEIVRQFNESNLIIGLESVNKLADEIKNIHNKSFDKYKSNTKNIISLIEKFIEDNIK